MKFGYTIVYVPDVLASVEFFERAFGLKRRFVHESGYGEMETGATALASAAARANAMSPVNSIKSPCVGSEESAGLEF